MSRQKSTTFSGLTKGYYDRLPGQGRDVPYPAPASPVLEKLYNLVQVGEYLRLGVRPLIKAISEGRLTSSFVGKQHLVSESAIAAYLRNQQGTSPYGKKLPPEGQDAEMK